MKCNKCGAKANSELCFTCKPKKPLSSGKGLKIKMSSILNKKPKNVHNDGHIIQKTNPHNHYEVLKENEKIIKILQKSIEADKLKQFFIEQWNTRPNYSEISGEYLGNSYSSIYLHHILPKSKYSEACFDEENIVFLTADEHASIELDMYKYEKVNKKRELLKIKYNIL